MIKIIERSNTELKEKSIIHPNDLYIYTYNRRDWLTGARNLALIRRLLSFLVGRNPSVLPNRTVVSKATILDPRFKKIAFGTTQNADAAESRITEELSEMIEAKRSSANPQTHKMTESAA